ALPFRTSLIQYSKCSKMKRPRGDHRVSVTTSMPRSWFRLEASFPPAYPILGMTFRRAFMEVERSSDEIRVHRTMLPLFSGPCMTVWQSRMGSEVPHL